MRTIRDPRRGAVVTARRALGATLLAALAAACGGAGETERLATRMWTDDMIFSIALDPVPPPAREEIRVKVVVRDKETKAPIDDGEGRIYAMNRDSAKVFDGLVRGPEPGTYYAKLRFVTAGEWAIGLQFRRDSTQALQKMDWLQQVAPERP
jgi:hypothetical protein